MMKRRTWTAKVALLLGFSVLGACPSVALANGGPVEWTEGTPQGGLSLRQETVVRLDSEELVIKLDQDLNHYEVRATYWLDNPGIQAKVKVGVPMQWGGKRTPSIIAKDVFLEVGGKILGCEPAYVKQQPIDPDAETGPASMPKGSAWCVATVSIPKGPEVGLTLSYRGELEFDDLLYTRSALKEFGHRTLRYPLFPAGYWAGKVKHISIRIALGPYRARDVVNKPKGAKVFDSHVEWEGHDVDLKHAPDLEVELDGRAKLRTKEIATWNAEGPEYGRLPLTVRVSSTLVGEGTISFVQENMLDGKPDTAWCSAGPGDGEWVEIAIPRSEGYRLEQNYSLDQHRESRNNLEAIAVVPGFARSANTFQEYGRPRKLLIGRCGGRSANILGEMDVDSTAAYDETATTLPIESRDHYDRQWTVRRSLASDLANGRNLCLRFTIYGIIPGTSPHTCISEISFILNGG